MKHPNVVSEARTPYGLRPAELIEHITARSWRSSRHRMTEAQYLALDTMDFIEFTNGVVEYLPVPNELHQPVSHCFLHEMSQRSAILSWNSTACAET